MTNQSIEIEEPPTLQIQLDISIIIRPLTMFFLKVHTLSHKSHCFLYFIYLIFLFLWRTDMEINGFWCIWIPEFHQIWFHVSSHLSFVLFSFSFLPCH